MQAIVYKKTGCLAKKRLLYCVKALFIKKICKDTQPMMIPTLLAMRDFSRMREIITVLTKYGLGGFVQRIRLGAAGGDEVHPDSVI